MDLGSRAARAYENFELVAQDPPPPTRYEGQSFLHLEKMSQDFVFWTRKDEPSFGFEALVRGGASERMAIYIDGVRMGAANLRSEQIRVVRITQASHPVSRGRHRLTIALSRPRDAPPGADIGWIRLGEVSKDNTDQPATEDRVFSEVTIGDERHAAIVVRPGSTVSCPLHVLPEAELLSSVGVWGAGMAEGEIAVIDQSGEEHIVGRELREPDQKRNYEPLSVSLRAFASQLVDIEFRALPHDRSAQVVFGSPRISLPALRVTSSPRAQRAVVVILGALGPRHTPPASANAGLPVLNQLAQVATSYTNYRATSTSVTSIIASLLTGLPPYRHGLSGIDSSLSTEFSTLSSAVEAASGRSAFMTGVPTSSSEFGFDRGFESFVSTLPQQDVAAVEPISQARDWLKATATSEGPVLSIIHLRGAHPPFDISRERARELPPAEYGGDLSPRRAAIQLGAVARRRERYRVLGEEDWTRLFAMEKAALLRQSEALNDLLLWMRQSELYDDTLLVVMGDVAAGNRPDIPYRDTAPLDERFLAVPLIVKFPKGYRAGESVDGAFAPRDIARTIAATLGLDFDPPDGDSIDLGRLDASDLAKNRPHIAFVDHDYSMRLGGQLLMGQDGSAPSLCFYEIDPACQINRDAEHPSMTHSLWLTLFSELHDALKNAPEPIPLERKEALTNALIVWGVLM